MHSWTSWLRSNLSFASTWTNLAFRRGVSCQCMVRWRIALQENQARVGEMVIKHNTLFLGRARNIQTATDVILSLFASFGNYIELWFSSDQSNITSYIDLELWRRDTDTLPCLSARYNICKFWEINLFIFSWGLEDYGVWYWWSCDKVKGEETIATIKWYRWDSLIFILTTVFLLPSL